MESDRLRGEQPEASKPVGFGLVLLSAYPIPFLGHNLDPTPSFSAENPRSEWVATRHLSSSWAAEGIPRQEAWKIHRQEVSRSADSLALRDAGEKHLCD